MPDFDNAIKLVFSTGLASQASTPPIPGECCSTDLHGRIKGNEYDISTVQFLITVYPGFEKFSINWRFATEELNSICRNPTDIEKYNDFFEVIVTLPNGQKQNIALLPNGNPVNVVNAFNGGFLKPSPSNICYNLITDTMLSEFDLTPFPCQELLINFKIADVGDALVDSAVYFFNPLLLGTPNCSDTCQQSVPTAAVNVNTIFDWVLASSDHKVNVKPS